MEHLDKNPERDPGECAGCGKHVDFRGEKDGRKYCTNCCELGNFVDGEGEDDTQEDPEVDLDFYNDDLSREDTIENFVQYVKDNPGCSMTEAVDNIERDVTSKNYCRTLLSDKVKEDGFDRVERKGEGRNTQYYHKDFDSTEVDSDDDTDPEPEEKDEVEEQAAEEDDEGNSASDQDDRIEAETTDPELENLEPDQEDPDPSPADVKPIANHYFVSVMEIEPPESGLEDSIFVAYTDTKSNSDQSPERAVAGLIE